jgi:predicted enzyme related to lactoylglutathione lyase
VEVVREEQEESAGRFAWIVDPEGNRVELWEPKPGVFE